MKTRTGHIAAIVLMTGLAACSTGPTPQTAANDDPDRPVCRRITPTGTTLRVKDCRTAAEWADYEARAKAGIEDTMRSTDTRGAS